ncbi:MAG TPA: hypothetical protein VEU30_10620, partial [Thermoanaerobaculia bacterium]|nr:hypothetical protein [Thermoanaerobaculia bacterium]
MKQTLARWISIAAHPFVTGTVMVAAAASIRIAAAFVILAVVPLLVLSFRQVRRGKWEHVDASNRRERPLLYAMGIAAA